MNVPPQAPKKTPIIVWIALTVGGVGVACVAAFLWWAWPAMRAGAELFHQMEASTRAPGAEAVRAIGCSAAGVFEYDQVPEGARQMYEDARRKGLRRWVWCARPKGSDVGCDAVAKAYLLAVPKQPGPFTANVKEQDSPGQAATREICSADFAADGALRR